MKKLFFFRSGSTNGSSNPPPPQEKVYWEKPSESNGSHTNKQSHDTNKGSKKSFKPRNQQNSTGSVLRRCRSFSSPSTSSDPGDHDLDPKRSTSTSSPCLYQELDGPNWHRSLTPERIIKSRKAEQKLVLESVENYDYSGSTRGFAESPENSPCTSPVPLKCQAPRLSQVSNEVLDLYIDGEHQENRPRSDTSQRSSPLSCKDGPLAESRILPGTRRPPRIRSRGPTSPTNFKGNLRSYSFRETRDCHARQLRGRPEEDVWPSSPHRLAKSVVDRLTEEFPPKSRHKSQEFNCETSSTTVEDIFEAHSELHPCLNPNTFLEKIDIVPDVNQETTNEYCLKGTSGLAKQSFLNGNDFVNTRHEQLQLRKEEEIDLELHRKGKEAEERFLLLSEKLEEGALSVGSIMDEMRNLVFEVSAQLQSRLTERTCAREALKLAKMELDSRTRRLEKEKNELQASLEKDLDRRSREWSVKLEKYQSEEQRLRERVRELAEQNVSLQREVSQFNTRDMEARNKMTDLESQLNSVTLRMEEMGADNCKLQTAVADLEGRSEDAESDRDSISRRYREKEKEIKDLQKEVARLQRIYSEQEKTISGLRQGVIEEIGRQSSEKCDSLVNLQLEQVRLTGVEHSLRKEIESYRAEVDSLRHENISLLHRLNGGRSSQFRLEEELHAQVEYFQHQCFSLLDDGSHIYAKLLEFVKVCQNDDRTAKGLVGAMDSYSILEYDMKLQSFRKGVENIKRGLQTLSTMLQDKVELDTRKCQSPASGSLPLEEYDIERELKVEKLLTKALREKLYSQNLELEQLRSDVATSVRGNDLLRCEIQRAKDAFSSISHKMKDLELQMMRKDESINQLQMELQQSMKELTVTRGILPKVSEERDMMWEEVKQYSEKNMLLNCELASLKKKIEALDEDILLKEGQITILKDSLNKKPFEILYDPISNKDFIL
ncbi:hypothetical protein H6P81_003001 [Aristolochia fimbriata]|uniref:DUF7653 domain-containing protein n=1 Tax=Aristolochia fimbriata TaxID=158543 RepID=A0AAV7FFV1_ARIFI|nr:hypothetical protein H6P81_003001 [Aristolochia fimbriata]